MLGTLPRRSVRLLPPPTAKTIRRVPLGSLPIDAIEDSPKVQSYLKSVQDLKDAINDKDAEKLSWTDPITNEICSEVVFVDKYRELSKFVSAAWTKLDPEIAK